MHGKYFKKINSIKHSRQCNGSTDVLSTAVNSMTWQVRQLQFNCELINDQ